MFFAFQINNLTKVLHRKFNSYMHLMTYSEICQVIKFAVWYLCLLYIKKKMSLIYIIYARIREKIMAEQSGAIR